uniref:Left-right determination factor n=1 Tax=Petromyzon marinus TaxID=7757 RepID=S4R844_PETMA
MMMMTMALMMIVALVVVIPGAHGYLEEEVKASLLGALGLKEPPRIEKRDLESVIVPAAVRARYASMLQRHRERSRRSLPSLAGIFRGLRGNADIAGDVVFEDATRQRLTFDMRDRIPDNSEVTLVELRLFKTAPGGAFSAAAQRRHPRPANHARVSVFWLEEPLVGAMNRSTLVDSRLVPVGDSGWKGFDVTQAVQHWQQQSGGGPLRLEVRVEGERPGSHAAHMASLVRFTPQEAGEQPPIGKPELVVYTLNLAEYGGRGDCELDSSHPDHACCRGHNFINFRELTWTQYWVLEPAGYEAFRCTGGCRQPRPLHSMYGPRHCSPVESSPLPMMYLVKKGDYTEIEVAEFPNMIVEKCGCAMDNISVV